MNEELMIITIGILALISIGMRVVNIIARSNLSIKMPNDATRPQMPKYDNPPPPPEEKEMTAEEILNSFLKELDEMKPIHAEPLNDFSVSVNDVDGMDEDYLLRIKNKPSNRNEFYSASKPQLIQLYWDIRNLIK